MGTLLVSQLLLSSPAAGGVSVMSLGLSGIGTPLFYLFILIFILAHALSLSLYLSCGLPHDDTQAATCSSVAAKKPMRLVVPLCCHLHFVALRCSPRWVCSPFFFFFFVIALPRGLLLNLRSSGRSCCLWLCSRTKTHGVRCMDCSQSFLPG